MNDGGMGSLQFDTTKQARMFGRTLVEGWFKDEDGLPVVLYLNLDKDYSLGKAVEFGKQPGRGPHSHEQAV